MARPTFKIAFAAALALVAACTVHKQDSVPDLSGPSELATSVVVQVSPDLLTQDGASQSQVTIIARDAHSQPLRSLSLRAEITVNGAVADFGSLSARNVVTDSNGRATLVYTAPPAPAVAIDTGTIVSISVTPAGTDAGNATARSATIRLVPPGVVGLPPTGLTPQFTVNPLAPTDHQSALFDASSSTTTGATIVAYQWNFGDGGTGSGITAQHTYDSAGTFVVKLTITDSIGRVNSTSQSVNVGAGQTPTARIISSPAAPIIGQTINFNGSTSLAAPGRTLTNFFWDFGDGTTGAGPQLSHVYTAAGNYTVLLSVSDDAGRKDSTTVGITVSNDIPHADFTFAPASPTVPLGGTTASAAFDANTSTAAPGRTITTYQWAFGDGSTGTGSTISHAFVRGTFTVVLTVTDNAGKTNTTSRTLTVN